MKPNSYRTSRTRIQVAADLVQPCNDGRICLRGVRVERVGIASGLGLGVALSSPDIMEDVLAVSISFTQGPSGMLSFRRKVFRPAM